ncbi:CDP-6-deoxy-delta-3,4-glucoseen reductase [Wenzhouxiangella marina]|uniref:CDP-6-deoxy-L-threo-D-glycero-4-hexulose-3-dehydrase reductase n=1 Tax=Wenzhouxiangella marina TaxID=1579979 RepID=A0A0K0XTM8_9GAMM|nr:CDP-6-deoxy-delta-3,4-glucoseen reductase [Wenzhouxiangella marina]AKS41038.1 CDP-6-deoxy-L-threo-D-glycero-4-hexulose-3-dehydrase reductase [Wenzhouxiangella marina]MBB6087916.1 CDP-4-dehydro-6-deoxyglucose reductase [Wenzhouxiangella marina]
MTEQARAHRITLAASGRQFQARAGETLLSAALRQGVVLPYSCKNGTCASCRCRLEEGTVSYPHNPPTALEFEDLGAGFGLTCQAVAESDLVIDVREIEQVADIPVRLLPARVESMERFTPEIMRLRLKLPRAARLQFLAGQYIDILMPGGKRRAFSIASAPSEADFIELHIKHVDGGGFTGHVFSDMQEKEILRLEGPLGTFFVRKNSERPMIMMGGGTGFAPLKSMIEELIESGDERPLTLFWGVAHESDLYAQRLIEQWKRIHPSFRFVPVLNDPHEGWGGETGFVHEAVLRDRADLSAHDVYMSGPPAMVHAARNAFLKAGVAETHLFYDSFDFAPDVPPARD